MISRQRKLLKKTDQLNIDGILLTNLWDITWLTGFTGSSGAVLLTREGNTFLFTDFRYQEQFKEEVATGVNLILYSNSYFSKLTNSSIFSGNRLGFQSESVTYQSLKKLKESCPNICPVAVDSFCQEFSAIKEDYELALIQKAINITENVFEKLLNTISPEMTERDISAEISYWNKRYGADEDSFVPIVASGHHSALPHAKTRDQKIEKDTVLLIDMGCKYKGYCSDQTRTIVFGSPNEKIKNIYQIVLEAHCLGIEAIKPGKRTKDIDKVSRTYIESKGYGKFFGHALGHGIGLQIHESPRLSMHSKESLSKGNVVTVEPGIYLPKKFGIRIEDAVLVKENGSISLSKSPKHLISL